MENDLKETLEEFFKTKAFNEASLALLKMSFDREFNTMSNEEFEILFAALNTPVIWKPLQKPNTTLVSYPSFISRELVLSNFNYIHLSQGTTQYV